LVAENSSDEFAQIIQDEWQKIYGLCFRLMGNSHDAEDLCQEAFAKAFKNYRKFEGRSQVSTWIYRIVVNAWKNKLRSKKKIFFFGLFRGNDGSPSDEESGFPEPKGNDPLPEERLEKLESDKLLQEGLMSMIPEEREIIVLRDLEGKSYEELAGLFQIPLGTVKSRLSRARESLRLKLIPILKKKGEIA